LLLLLPIGLILIGVAIARARSRSIALIIKHYIIRGRRALNAATFTLSLQLQIEITWRITTSNFMRGSVDKNQNI